MKRATGCCSTHTGVQEAVFQATLSRCCYMKCNYDDCQSNTEAHLSPQTEANQQTRCLRYERKTKSTSGKVLSAFPFNQQLDQACTVRLHQQSDCSNKVNLPGPIHMHHTLESLLCYSKTCIHTVIHCSCTASRSLSQVAAGTCNM